MNTNPQTPKSYYNGSGRPAGFTLLELLVVIGIIAVLAALAYPSISGVAKRGKQMKCCSNLRQWAIAIRGYAGDHNQMVRFDSWESIGTSAKYYERYFGTLTLSWPNGKAGSSQGYFRMCPSMNWNGTGNPPASYLFVRAREMQSNGSYAKGGVDTDGDGAVDSYSLVKAAHPSQFLMMMDSTQAASPYQPSDFNTYVKPICDPGSSQRHSAGVNALFADGHVDYLLWDAIDPGKSANTQKVNTWFNLD